MGKGNCKACKNLGCAARGSNWTPNPAVECFGYDPLTNADRIRAKNDKELAEWIVQKSFGFGFDGYEDEVNAWYEWLKQPAETGADNG